MTFRLRKSFLEERKGPFSGGNVSALETSRLGEAAKKAGRPEPWQEVVMDTKRFRKDKDGK